MPWVLIPAKSFRLAKQRLSPVLDERGRIRLATTMLVRTISIARQAFGANPLIVVTSDEEVADVALNAGADGVAQAIDAGLNAELALAARQVPCDQALLVLHADLPQLQVEELRDFAGNQAAVAIATDWRGRGTNALLLRTPERFFAFGPESRKRHQHEANARHVEAIVVRSDGLAHDLDDAEDWRMLTANEKAAREFGKLLCPFSLRPPNELLSVASFR